MSDLSQFSMMELFRTEAETQLQTLTTGLLAFEHGMPGPDVLEAMMRAAHSMKGAARIVGVEAAVHVAHAMEDAFVAIQKARIAPGRGQVDVLLEGVDLLTRIAKTDESDLARWDGADKAEVMGFVTRLKEVREAGPAPTPTPPTTTTTATATVVEPAAEGKCADDGPSSPPNPAGETPKSPTQAGPATTPVESSPSAAATASTPPKERQERVLRVKAEHINRMLGLAGESLVESRWLQPFGKSLLRLRQLQGALGESLRSVQEACQATFTDERTLASLARTQSLLSACQDYLVQRHAELDMFDRRSTNLSYRLYHEALACRMRPFSDGLRGFPRMVRDVARALGKEVKLEIVGEDTQVDRDILERLEAPLTHLIRNAIDHGLELPDERERLGKPREGTLRIEARHSAGRLLIVASDDGRGIEIERVRRTVVRRGLTTQETVQQMSDAELLEFLFLPGFSVREQVTEISGRGVGLDVVQSMVKSVRGTIRVLSEQGKGTRFQLQLPLTMSVLRTLLVEVRGEPYAFPLAHVLRTLKLPRSAIETLEGRQHFQLEGRRISLLSAHQVLGLGEPSDASATVPVVVLGESNQRYGLAVDQFLGERELVVQPLDPRLGKVKDISSGSVTEDGLPVLIVDVEDLIRSIEKLAEDGTLRSLRGAGAPRSAPRKRVLVVDDSLTVRELQRKLLASRGYEVELAVDGVDGWNALRSSRFDLLISDVDMPRMDGVELIGLVKKDHQMKRMPAMIVSYKDREEDRRRGLEAGADYYLSKGSFHDDTLVQAVQDLIGPSGVESVQP